MMKKTFENMSFRKKLFYTYIVIGIIPIIALTIIVYFQYKDSLENGHIKKLQLSSDNITEELNLKLNQYKTDMARMIYDIRINDVISGELDKEEFSDIMYDYAIPYINLVSSMDIGIKEILIYADEDYGTWVIKDIDEISGNTWYEDTINSKHTVINAVEDEIIISRKQSSIYYKKPNSIIVFYINKQMMFYNIFNNADVGILVLDNNNRVIAADDMSADIILEDNKDVEYTSDNKVLINKENYYYAKSNIDTVGWTVICYSKDISLVQDINSILLISIIITFSSFMVIIFLTNIFSKTIMKPIIRLNGKMKKVESGEFNIELGETTDDEIGKLEKRFKLMVDQINHLIEFEYKQELVLKDAELRALQARISPHFLYNTLSTINMKALLLESNEISEIVMALSTFYRTTLNSGKDVIMIKDELKNLKAYIKIQQAMYGDRFEVIYDIDEGLEKYYIINLILQPLVENAIEHGIDKIDEKGIIAIRVWEENNLIKFSVEDNGQGFNEENMHKKTSLGYGIYNVKQRLKIFFENKCSLKYEKSRWNGVKVVITVPKYKFGEDIEKKRKG